MITSSENMLFKGKIGDRIKLVYMGADPDPIPAGTLGTVTRITHLKFGHDVQIQVGVDWDNGRSLSCVCPPDFLEMADGTTAH